MTRNLTDKELLLGTTMFLLLYSIDENEVRGKRVRKKIIRVLKAKLAERRTLDPIKYLEVVNMGQEALELTKIEYHSRGYTELAITPSAMLNLLHYRYPEEVSIFNINPIDRLHLTEAYSSIPITWNTIIYTNIMVRKIYEILNIQLPESYI